MNSSIVVSQATDPGQVEALRQPPDGGRSLSETGHETSRWEPIRPPAEPISPRLWVVDGVQRQEATVAEIAPDGRPVTVGGVGAAAAGGALLRPDRAATGRLVTVTRVLATSVPGGTPMGTALVEAGVAHREILNEGKGPFGAVLTDLRKTLEVDTRRAAQQRGGWVLADGRYNGAHGRTVGLAKRHQRKYLTDRQYGTVEQLDVGERTPLFKLETGEWSWYLRIQRNRFGAWSGMVRLETGAGFDRARRMADLFAGWLPKMCSRERHDPRAPENLMPISTLEKHLRKRLGNRTVIRRAAVEAVTRMTRM